MDNNEFHSNSGEQPKPLKRLIKADHGDQGEYHGQHEADAPVYHGKHEMPPKLHYVKPEEREARRRAAEQARRRSDPRMAHSGKKRKKGKKPPEPPTKKEIITNIAAKILSVAMALAMSALLVLNMPILVDKENGGNISIVNYIKSLKVLAKEGELDKSNVDLQLDPDVYEPEFNDGLDLPQLIEGQYSILFLGFDEDEFNTDVMWVVQCDIGHGGLNILQIPRDCCLPDYTRSVTRKFNSVYSMGDPGIQPPIQRTVNAVQENFGIPIDAYITTACFDIVDIVDIIGGIPINVDKEIIYEADKIIPAGQVTLTGEQAEWFIRFRREWMQGDIGRMQNQRKFMAAAMQKLFSIVKDEGRVKLYSYIKEIYDKELVYTDLSIGDLGKIADFASTINMDEVHVNMVPGEDAVFYAADGNAYSVYSVHKQETIDLLNEYYRPYQKTMTSSDTAIVELVTDHQYSIYDDTGASLEEIEKSTEPMRDPNKKPWWKKDD